MPYEGQTATGTGKYAGTSMVFHNGQWVNAATPGSPMRRVMSPQEAKTLNELNNDAAKAYETKTLAAQATGALQRLKPGPFRGMALDAAIPSEKGGFWDKAAATVLGGPAKALGLLPDQDVTDYQNVDRIKQLGILEEQTRQKGVQTEGDAARIALAGISPYKTMDANNAVRAQIEAKAGRAIGRAPFYTAWANKYGLNGVDEHGQSVEQAFQKSLAAAPTPAPAPAPAPKGSDLGSGWKLLKVQ